MTEELQNYSPEEVEQLIILNQELQTENERYRQQNSQQETQIRMLLSEKQKLSEQVLKLKYLQRLAPVILLLATIRTKAVEEL